jgi:hypothetical protein
MHPLLSLPIALVGFFLGKKAAGPRGDASAGVAEKEPAHPELAAKAVRVKTARDLSQVDTAGWEEFVSVMESAPRDKISSRYKLGAFQMDARKLADVGAMTEARKVSYGPEMGVWMGKWAPGLSERAFLGSMPLQYAAFVRSVRATAPKVSQHVGKVVEGKTATLSGLLGVAHVAGIAGVASWVSEPAVRKRFASTTSMFHRTNGIF